MHDSMSSSSIDQSASGAAAFCTPSRGIVAAFALLVVACSVHVLAGQYGMAADSLWFTLAGAGFMAVTIAAHLPLSLGRGEASGAIGSLLISMAIRLSGTFVILGWLMWFSPLERSEAVFNVLFWYITLTATDLIDLVRDRRRLESASAAGRSRTVS